MAPSLGSSCRCGWRCAHWPSAASCSDTFLTGHGPFPFRVLGLGAADPCSRPSRVVSPTKGITRKSDLLKTKTDLRPHS